MDRIVGVETEYGCLMSSEELRCNSEVWPAKVKNYLFNKARAGTIDLHYRDYEEPPGNGGFLLNGGRLYLDMGHIEYASPECLHLHDLVTYEMAGDELLRSSLTALEAGDRVSFIKNNVDHHTGATFGCHENYLMKREAQFTPSVLGTLLTFLATRQIFTGAGRVGQANPLAFDFEPPQAETPGAARATSPAIRPANGSSISRMAKLSARSTSNGNSTISPSDICAGKIQKPIGCSRLGVLFSNQSNKIRRRSSGASIGSPRNGC